MPDDEPAPLFRASPPGVVRALARRMRLADFTLTSPLANAARTVSYVAARMPCPRTVVLAEEALAEPARIASGLAGLPVLTHPDLVDLLGPEGEPVAASTWAPLAELMAYLHRLQPLRWERKWGLAGVKDPAPALERRWMLGALPRAHFLITGPSLSLAFRYWEGLAAPMIWALGRGNEAVPLRDLALKKRIPVVERGEYTDRLPEDLRVGGYLPEEHWSGTIEIMHFVYQLHRRRFRAAWSLDQDDDEGEEWKRGRTT